MNRSLLAMLASSALVGCLYSDVHAPLSYRSATPGDVGGQIGGETTGSSCNTAILWLVAWGDGGYEAAVADAKSHTSTPLLADVRADTQYTNVFFGFYQRQCTVVTGRTVAVAAAPPPPAPPPAPAGAP